MPEELASFLEVIEGGKQVTGEVVQFSTDMAGAGAALEGIETEVVAANGAATTVSQLTVVEGGATTTAGVGLLGLELPAAAAAIAPALGVAAGVGLYNLAPGFWTKVSNGLMEAGETIGGKVRAFVNEHGILGLSETAINVFKNALIDAGVFESGVINQPQGMGVTLAMPVPVGIKRIGNGNTGDYDSGMLMPGSDLRFTGYNSTLTDGQVYRFARVNDLLLAASDAYCRGALKSRTGWPQTAGQEYSWTFNGKTVHFCYQSIFDVDLPGSTQESTALEVMQAIAWLMLYGEAVLPSDLQPEATYPNKDDPIDETYPDWTPWQININLPKIYPLDNPDINPNPDQQQSQDPEPVPSGLEGVLLNWLLDAMNVPNPIPNPALNPDPVPDPDPVPKDPDPVPKKEIETTDPDPIPPDPIPPDPPIPPFVPIVPDSVSSNAMFTVYRPSLQQINAFGAWLWTSSIIEQIARLWQDPMDGIISLMKVYANPTVGSSQNIIVGFLDSGVSAPVITSQFVTVDCGTINISEFLQNATDYPPYTQLEVYLPFIGIVEVDVTDFMDGSMSIEYGIDVYTGTCLATIKATRTKDMPNATALYTFSGNASQQLPLSNASFAGAIQTLVGAVGGGLAIASGGALAGVAGMAALGSSLTHEMIHVSHGGSLSANAGIMGARVPYAIISRQHSYDAAWYNQMYGYPANKTVFIGNCNGFIRIKKCLIHSSATETEIEEMYNLLENGVIA